MREGRATAANRSGERGMGAAAHQLAGADGEESTTAEKMPTGTAASSSAGQPGGEGDGNGDEQQPGGVVFDLER